jgi:hypothetical protein
MTVKTRNADKRTGANVFTAGGARRRRPAPDCGDDSQQNDAKDALDRILSPREVLDRMALTMYATI